MSDVFNSHKAEAELEAAIAAALTTAFPWIAQTDTRTDALYSLESSPL